MEKIRLVPSILMRDEYYSDNLLDLDKTLQEGKDKDTNWAYTHYFYLYQIKGDMDTFSNKEITSTIFTIRKPGCTLGFIEVDSELKVIKAKYYTDETTQKVIDKEKLDKNSILIKNFLNKQVEIDMGKIIIKTEQELINYIK